MESLIILSKFRQLLRKNNRGFLYAAAVINGESRVKIPSWFCIWVSDHEYVEIIKVKFKLRRFLRLACLFCGRTRLADGSYPAGFPNDTSPREMRVRSLFRRKKCKGHFSIIFCLPSCIPLCAGEFPAAEVSRGYYQGCPFHPSMDRPGPSNQYSLPFMIL